MTLNEKKSLLTLNKKKSLARLLLSSEVGKSLVKKAVERLTSKEWYQDDVVNEAYAVADALCPKDGGPQEGDDDEAIQETLYALLQNEAYLAIKKRLPENPDI